MSTTLAQQVKWLWEDYKYLALTLLVLVLILTTVARAFWGEGDVLGVWLAITSVFCWAGVLYAFFTTESRKDLPWVIPAAVSAACIIDVVVAALSLFLVYSSSSSGVWINGQSGQTTLSGTLSVRPFQRNVFFVPRDFSSQARIRVQTADGVPLSCVASAGGIMLDYSNPDALAEFLFKASTAGNPRIHIRETLNAAVARAAANALGGKTTAEIAQMREFVLPWRTGAPVAGEFGRLHLRWQSGSASVGCSVRFDN